MNIIGRQHGPHFVIAGALLLLLAGGRLASAQGHYYAPAEPVPPPKPEGPPSRRPMTRDVAQQALNKAGFTNLSQLTPWFDGWEAVARNGGRSMIVTIENNGAIIAPSPQWFPPLQAR